MMTNKTACCHDCLDRCALSPHVLTANHGIDVNGFGIVTKIQASDAIKALAHVGLDSLQR
jgi:hypothetical protein